MAKTIRRGLGNVEIVKPKNDLRMPAVERGGDQFDRLKAAANTIISEVGDFRYDLPKTKKDGDFGKSEIKRPKRSDSKKRPKKKQLNPPLSQRREQLTKNGERSKRLDVFLYGKDLSDFELLKSILQELMPDNKPVKNNDLVRSFVPTFLRIAKFIDKNKLPKRPRYGTDEYRPFIEEFADAIWDAVLTGIANEVASAANESRDNKTS